jgi:hypothetical protein
MRYLSKCFAGFASMLLVICLQSSTFGQNAGDVGGDSGSKVIRIGVLLPKVQLSAASGEVSPQEALRNTYAALMNSDSFQLVALDARLTSLAFEEAKKLECDYILNVDLSQEVKKSGGGFFGKVLNDAASRSTYEVASKVPTGGGTGERIVTSATQNAIIETGYTMSQMSVTVKKNDKFVLDYNLTMTDSGSVIHTNKIESKAQNNNDPVLMQMIEQSANDLVTVLKRKKL